MPMIAMTTSSSMSVKADGRGTGDIFFISVLCAGQIPMAETEESDRDGLLGDGVRTSVKSGRAGGEHLIIGAPTRGAARGWW